MIESEAGQTPRGPIQAAEPVSPGEPGSSKRLLTACCRGGADDGLPSEALPKEWASALRRRGLVGHPSLVLPASRKGWWTRSGSTIYLWNEVPFRICFD